MEPASHPLLRPGLAALWRDCADVADPPGAGAVQRLRQDHPEATSGEIAAILTQVRLRRRVRGRWGPVADDFLFTDDGAQQATHPVVAARRAALAAHGGVTELFDLGCGIGMDALAFARAGITVTAIERDPDTAAVAAHNLAGSARVVCADAREQHVPATAAAFVDPGRRRADGATGRRVMDPQRWEPPWSWVLALAQRHPATVAKAAPGIDHALLPRDARVEWVSLDGTLVETTVWFAGIPVPPAWLNAVVMTGGTADSGPGRVTILSGDDRGEPVPAAPPGTWLLEPDPAVIRSGLLAVLADRVAGRVLSPGIAYLTTDALPEGVPARVDRILAQLPARPKALRAELNRLGYRSAEIRTRGLALDPAQLRARLHLAGGAPTAHLVITRAQGNATALLVEPVQRRGGSG